MKGIPHSVSARDFERYCPSSPLLSSLQFDWEGVTVRAYQKPKEAEQAIFPTVPDVSLTLVTQGAERKRAVEHAQRLNPLEKVLPEGG